MSRLAPAIALSLALAAGPSLAAEGGRIAIELNDLQQADAGCRAVFVVKNGLPGALDKIVVRVVAFDKAEHATRFLSIDFGPMPAGKTRVARFDLGDKAACGEVSRMLLDDVTACAGGGMEPATCLAALSLSSRAAVPLDY
jgi:hypothetical protein